jgi:large-conductance mechanosensitive channel
MLISVKINLLLAGSQLYICNANHKSINQKTHTTMKKLSYLLMAFAIFAFVSCNNKPKEEVEEVTTEEVAPVEETTETPAEEVVDDVVEEQK